MAFKKVQNLLLINYNDGFINDDEFVVLYMHMHKKSSTVHTIHTHFLTWKSSMSLRVSQSFALENEIRILKEVLQIPDTITCSQNVAGHGFRCFRKKSHSSLLKIVKHLTSTGAQIIQNRKPGRFSRR